MTDEQIENANNLLNRIFVGKQFEEVVSVSRELEEEFLSYREIFESVIDAIEPLYYRRRRRYFGRAG